MSNENDFKPTKAMQLFKSKLHKAVEKSPLLAVEAMSTKDLARYGGSRTVEKWMQIEGFESWVRDAGFEKAKLDSCAEAAIDALYDIVSGPIDAKQGRTASAKVSAAGKILEAAGLIKTGKEAADNKEDVSKLSTEELRRRAAELLGDDYAN